MRLFTLAPSLGGVESLVSIPVLTSHLTLPAEERKRIGVTEQMIRLSVGIENADDLIADLEHALEAVAASERAAVGGGALLASGSSWISGLFPDGLHLPSAPAKMKPGLPLTPPLGYACV